MLKKILLSFVLLILAAPCIHAENGDSTTLRQYYALVHSASVAVCKGDYHKASGLFDSAFTMISYPFHTDINNAIYATIYGENPDTAALRRYFDMLQKKGVNIYEKYHRYENYRPYIVSYQAEDSGTVTDKAAQHTIQDAISNDQELRLFSKNYYDEYYHNSLLPAIDKIDSVNFWVVDSILHLSITSGIPIENLIGINAFWDVDIILGHNGGWGRYNKLLCDSMVRLGLMDARVMAHFYDDNCGAFYKDHRIKRSNWKEDYQCDEFYGIYGTLILYVWGDVQFILFLNENEKEVVDRNREHLYLQNIYEECKIRAFAFYHRQEGFSYPMIKMFPGTLEEIKEFESHILEWRPHYIKYNGYEDYELDRQ